MTALWLMLKGLPWKLIGLALAAGLLVGLGWRATVWRHAYAVTLPATKAELAAERTCEPLTACGKRIATLAAEAEQKAAQAAAEAVRGAAAREEQARRDAAAWRAKYRAAVQENPECADWSSQPVRCPL